MFAVIFLFVGFTALAQSDSIVYNHGVPVGDDDTVQFFPSRDLGENSQRVPVAPDKLPVDLKKTLATKSTYQGWDKFPVYLNRASGLYDVTVLHGGDTVVFVLSADGSLVSIGNRSIDDQ